ncbi:hypothetical protein F1654_08590 [Alkalicaulis satelles]|uniref:Porin n=1 Tax=Alkalicaulis satelles TaxID=2609175 RepID=A0A5M6ZGH3_9PROT|nr:hypothetical protein [Alkalicaulis satelles]KAA5803846.1 hypothetical protein F1654_08590 [Alkalicaulis satelles]
MTRLTLMAACSLAALAAAASGAQARTAQLGWLDGVRVRASADFDLVTAARADAQRTAPWGAAALYWQADGVRDSGLRWGIDITGKAITGDGRRGLARPLEGPCPCPLDAGGRPLAGLMTGLSGASGDAASGRAALEEASVWAQGGWLRVRAGVAQGAAAQERPDLPGALRTVRADGALFDPTGLALVDTSLPLAGPAPGVSVQTRRIIGLRATASYTPDAQWRSVRRAWPASDEAVRADIRDVWSLGASFDRRSPASGVRWQAQAGWEAGRAAGPHAGAFRDPWAGSARLVRQSGDLTLAASWLRGNDGLADARYEAVSAAAAYEYGDWLFSLEAGAASAGLAQRNGRSVQAGASRLIGERAVIGLSVSLAGENRPGAPDRRRVRAALETGLRF